MDDRARKIVCLFGTVASIIAALLATIALPAELKTYTVIAMSWFFALGAIGVVFDKGRKPYLHLIIMLTFLLVSYGAVEALPAFISGILWMLVVISFLSHLLWGCADLDKPEDRRYLLGCLILFGTIVAAGLAVTQLPEVTLEGKSTSIGVAALSICILGLMGFVLLFGTKNEDGLLYLQPLTSAGFLALNHFTVARWPELAAWILVMVVVLALVTQVAVHYLSTKK